jgi:phage terminase Nu1 subunit (DNA packaging protein)
MASTKEISELLNLTPQGARQLCDKGILQRVEPNVFDAPASVAAYIRYREQRVAAEFGGGLGTLANGARLSLQRAAIAQLERLQLEGRLIPVEQITTAWTAIMTTVRQRILTVPGRAEPEPAGACDRRAGQSHPWDSQRNAQHHGRYRIAPVQVLRPVGRVLPAAAEHL